MNQVLEAIRDHAVDLVTYGGLRPGGDHGVIRGVLLF